MAVSKQPSITPETSSGEGVDDEITSRGEAKWKRFHPFRVVRKIFRRRIKREGTAVSDASKKSWSTSELQSVDDDGVGKCEVTSPLKIGLSVSHDSIFSPENNATGMGSETLSVPHGSSLSIHQTSIKNMFKDELFTRVRARRDSDDEDDIGLPRSPCTSPTTVDVLIQGLKKSSKSQTTCSAGSLISMGSSDNDEDSAGQSSGHSSRMSLIDRRSLDSDGDMDLNQSVPLNHNAARHKIAVKPKRKYGLPRRRMNQIAAAKLSTLPSTPEVVEDNGKLVQKLETVDLLQVVKESNSSQNGTVSMQTSELKVVHTSFSCSEMSEFSESLIQDKTSSESNVHLIKRNRDYDPMSFDDNLKKIETIRSNSDVNEQIDVSNSKDKLKMDNKDRNIKHDSLKQNFIDKQEEFIFHEIKYEDTSSVFGNETVKNTSKSDISSSISLSSSFQNQIEETIKVSSLVRNIERSESFKGSENSSKSIDGIEKVNDKLTDTNVEGQNISLLKSAENIEETKGIDNMCDIFKQMSPSNSNSGDKLSENHMSILPKDTEYIAPVVQDVNKLNIDCEFILKPLKKECVSEKILDPTSSESFPVCEKESSLESSTFFEEESIMSSKTLSMGVEEGGIFVSHHASVQNDLKDILVTEAHNYAAVEERNEVYIKNSDNKNSPMETETESWISSIGILSKPDVTVSTSSTICNNKMTEDKVTISVNSKHATKHRSTSLEKDIKKNIDENQKTVAFTKLDQNQQRVPVKETSMAKSIQKPNLLDGPITSSIKSTNLQKRVSVEIVPFSQRMKERKYQPLAFSPKEANIEKEKKISSTLVERKLSDRKIATKNKEADKSNNRHSFSGVIPSDKKETDKKPLKPEKVQYPVQIRIHKTVPTPENKDKINKSVSNKEHKSSFSKNFPKDEKLQMQSPKVKQKEVKTTKDKLIAENAKWEVKIQPASTHLASTSQMPNSDEICSPVVISEKSFISSKIESQPFSTLNENRDQEIESLSLKNNENNCRTSKEATPVLSDEPEPELLRVFARRSIKQKHCDKDKVNDIEGKPISDVSSEDLLPLEKTEDNKEVISVSHNSTVIKISEISKPHIKPDLKKKSKSFSEKERASTRSVSPLKEINLIHRESPTKLTLDASASHEFTHARQRVANITDVPLNLPPDVIKSSQYASKVEYSSLLNKEETQKANFNPMTQPTGPVNGNLASLGTVKENQELLGGKEAHAPSWLQLAQQRRELREQREKLLLGGSPNSFMDASNKPSRSSKVWDMVNNFQKLQMT